MAELTSPGTAERQREQGLNRAAEVLRVLAERHSTRRIFLTAGWHRCRCGALLRNPTDYWRHQAEAQAAIESGMVERRRRTGTSKRPAEGGDGA